MIENKDDPNHFYQIYLLEYFLILQRSNLILELQSYEEDEKRKLLAKLLFQAIFLAKREFDLGLRYEIYSRISQDKKMQTEISKHLLLFISNLMQFLNVEITPDEDLEEAEEIKMKTYNIEKKYSEPQQDVIRIPSFLSNDYDKRKALLRFWIYYQNHGRKHLSIAIESLYIQLMQKRDESNIIFTGSSVYSTDLNYEKYRLLGVKTVVSNIKSLIIDFLHAEEKNIGLVQQEKSRIDIEVNPLLNFLIRQFENISEWLELGYNQNFMGNALFVQQLKKDILSIISIIYFNLLNPKDKMNFLDKFYSPKYKTLILDKLNLPNRLNEVIDLALKYQIMGLFEEAILILEPLTSKTKEELRNINQKNMYEALGFPYLYIKKYESAKSILEKLISIDSKDIYYHSYLVLINFILNQNEEAYYHLNQLFLAEPDDLKTRQERNQFHVFNSELRSCIRNLLNFFNTEKFKKKIDGYLKKTPQQFLVKALMDFGNLTADLGFFELAKGYFIQAHNNTTQTQFKATSLQNIGSIASNMSQFKEAFDYYQKALEFDPECITIYENLSRNAELQNDSIQALSYIEQAIQLAEKNELDFEKHLFEIRKIHLEAAKGTNFILSKIPDDIRSFFTEAEYLMKEVYLSNENLQKNFGLIMVAYGNALDALLTYKITPFIINHLNNKYGNPPNKIPKELYNIKAFQELRKGRSISLGQWSIFISEILEAPLLSHLIFLKSAIPGKFNEKQWMLISNLTQTLAPYRNRGGHAKRVSFDEFKQIYTEMVEKFNDLIKMFDENYFPC